MRRGKEEGERGEEEETGQHTCFFPSFFFFLSTVFIHLLKFDSLILCLLLRWSMTSERGSCLKMERGEKMRRVSNEFFFLVL